MTVEPSLIELFVPPFRLETRRTVKSFGKGSSIYRLRPASKLVRVGSKTCLRNQKFFNWTIIFVLAKMGPCCILISISPEPVVIIRSGLMPLTKQTMLFSMMPVLLLGIASLKKKLSRKALMRHFLQVDDYFCLPLYMYWKCMYQTGSVF